MLTEEVMLHGTIRNDDFKRNTRQRCNVGVMLKPFETMLQQRNCVALKIVS